MINFEAMIPLVSEHFEKLKMLCKAHQVNSFYLFGSAAKKTAKQTSDLDFLVRFSPNIPLLDYADNYFDLLDKLKELFNRDIDLVSEKELRNPILISEINQTKIPIYES